MRSLSVLVVGAYPEFNCYGTDQRRCRRDTPNRDANEDSLGFRAKTALRSGGAFAQGVENANADRALRTAPAVRAIARDRCALGACARAGLDAQKRASRIKKRRRRPTIIADNCYSLAGRGRCGQTQRLYLLCQTL